MVFTHMNTIQAHLENTRSPLPGLDSTFPRGERLSEPIAAFTFKRRATSRSGCSATDRVVQGSLQMFSVSRCIRVIQSCQPDKSDQDCLGIKAKPCINT